MSTRAGLIPVRKEGVKVALWLLVLWWVLVGLYRLARLIGRSPVAMIGIAVASVVGFLYAVSPWLVLGLAVVAPTLLGLAEWERPELVERVVRQPLRSRYRGCWVYSRTWQAAMDTAGLSQTRHGQEYLPRLRSVTSTRAGDLVRVRMLPGQTLDKWGEVAQQLAQTYGVEDCRVRSVPSRPQLVDLWFQVDDLLVEPVEPVEAVGAPLTALPVGLREDGHPHTVDATATHSIVGGETGAGKGSVFWSEILQLVPWQGRGLVRLWGLDPKGGSELGLGEPLFDRFVCGGDDPEDLKGYEEAFALVLEDAVRVMRGRLARQRGKVRKHTPSTDEPLILIYCDETASLTAWVTDRAMKQRIASALSLLLSQGRAAGVLLRLASQDVRKETLPQRDLIPARTGLRFCEAGSVDLLLGPGAHDRGAWCDRISAETRGVGYVMLEGRAEPVRVRFAHVTDDHIRAAVQGLTERHCQRLPVEVGVGSAEAVEGSEEPLALPEAA